MNSSRHVKEQYNAILIEYNFFLQYTSMLQVAKNPLIQRRIDHWLISYDLQDDIDKSGITPSIELDHSAFFLKINSLEDQASGPSYWKF